MGEQEPLRERPKRERWFSKKQYEMLWRCWHKKDVSEWNAWRRKHRRMPVFLENANFQGANLEGAYFYMAHLKGAFLFEAHLQGANFGHAHLEGAWLRDSHLEGADFGGAHLEGAYFCMAYLEGANFYMADLEGADLRNAHLEGVNFGDAYLEGADFHMAAVGGGTLFGTRHVDRQTDFTGVGLDNARVAAGVKQLLEYNVRRLGWEKWYKEHRLAKWPVRAFWAMSDYGRSIRPILGWFFGLAAAFALVYWMCSLVWPPGIVNNLLADGKLSVPGWLLPFRALYFSIVTMTTLGFGDIYAYPTSFWGHLLLTLQVLLGYVLLAALVTRFAVLFTAGGPAAEFPDERSLLSGSWSRVRTREREDRPARPLTERLREEARKFQRRFRG